MKETKIINPKDIPVLDGRAAWYHFRLSENTVEVNKVLSGNGESTYLGQIPNVRDITLEYNGASAFCAVIFSCGNCCGISVRRRSKQELYVEVGPLAFG